mgnify:FL=1
MQRIAQLIITSLTICLLAACSSVPDKEWFNLIPENSTFVIAPEQGLNVQDIVTKEYISYLDDLTPTAIQHISGLDAEINSRIQVIALALYPATSLKSNFLWIAQTPDSQLSKWASSLYQPFTQNNYDFKGLIIHKLFFNKSDVFAAQVGDYLIMSESSLILENSIRSYLGEKPAIQLDQNPAPSSFVLNTPKLDSWIEQFANVNNRPAIRSMFSGTKPVSLNFESYSDSTNDLQLSGNIALTPNNRSVLVDAFSFENKPVSLDRHIAGNAGAFAILRLPPVSVPIKPTEGFLTALDSTANC